MCGGGGRDGGGEGGYCQAFKLCSCPALSLARFQHLGGELIGPQDIPQVAAKDILAFLRSAGLCEVLY